MKRLLLCLFGLSSLVGSFASAMQIVTSDEQQRTIEPLALKQAKTFAYVLEDAQVEGTLPLPITAQDFDLIHPYLKILAQLHKDAEEINKALQAKLQNQMNQELANIITISNYLEIKELWQQSLDMLAQRLQAPEYLAQFMARGTLDFTCPDITKKQIIEKLKNSILIAGASAYAQVMCNGNGFRFPYRWVYGHKDYIRTIKVNTMQTIAASVSDDETIRLWDARTGNCLHVLKVPYVECSIALNKSGTKMIAAFPNDVVKVWDTKKGILLDSWKMNERDLWGKSLRALTLTENDIMIAIAGDRLMMWDLATHERFHVTPIGQGEVKIALNTHESLLAVSCNQMVMLIDMKEHCVLWKNNHANLATIAHLCFDTTGQFIKTENYEHQNRKVIFIIDAHTDTVVKQLYSRKDYEQHPLYENFCDDKPLLIASTSHGDRWYNQHRFFIEYYQDLQTKAFLESQNLTLEQALIGIFVAQDMRNGMKWVNLTKYPQIAGHLKNLNPNLQEALCPTYSGWAGRIYRLVRPSNRILIRGAALAAAGFLGYKAAISISDKLEKLDPTATKDGKTSFVITTAGLSALMGYKLYEFLGLNKTHW